jgi:hypothetical protein
MKNFFAGFLMIIFTISFLAGCGNGNDSKDNSAPTVISTDPANLSEGVGINKKITASFSEEMDPLTITAETFTLTTPGITTVSGAVTYNGVTATFTPADVLEYATTYTATITSASKDLAGNSLINNHKWRFTTVAAPDVIAPMVSSTEPSIRKTGVAINKKISVSFSEEMDPLTITPTYTVTGPDAVPIAGIVTYVGVTATFTPENDLEYIATYTATITNEAKDLAGNSLNGNTLAGDYEWSFTTGAAPDTFSPIMRSTSPANRKTDVVVNKKITASFSEAMDPLTVSTETFTVNGPDEIPISGSVIYVGVTAIFTPEYDLEYETTYIAKITTGAKDLAGNALTNDHTWIFTTGAAPDITAPSVRSTDPANRTTDVAINKKIVAAFSEVMDPLTMTTETYTLTGPGETPVSGAVIYVGVSAIFTPEDDLEYNTSYTATITTGAKDLAGNALTIDHSWGLTTGSSPDIIAPSVSSTTPANRATGVAINKKIAVRFSEVVEPLTVTTETFTVTGPDATPIWGFVDYVGVTAIFTPADDLESDTTYTATITIGPEDLAGNALIGNTPTGDYEWIFTTSASPDFEPPTVISTVPVDLATDVPINRKIAITFSEAMKPLTITTATYTITGPDDIPIKGFVNYVGVTAIFTPADDLESDTTYTATITIGPEDLAGNALIGNTSPGNYEWIFTTSASSDFTLPAVISIVPFQVAADVPINQKIIITFSEVMNPLTITTESFTLKKLTFTEEENPVETPVPGTVTNVGVTAIFIPADDLEYDTTYTTEIAFGLEDLGGNLMTYNFWRFFTGSDPAAVAP